MRKTPFIALVVWAVSLADAIVFIPPVVYVVTLSLGAFVTNMFLFVALWLAVKGVTDRRYFGRSPHRILAFIFHTGAKTVVFLSSATLSTLMLEPVTPKETLGTGFAAGALGFVILFLSGYREYRLTPRTHRIQTLMSLTVFSLFIVCATYASVSFAHETQIIDTADTSTPAGSAMSPGIAYELSVQKSAYADYETERVFRFYPQNSKICRVYQGDTIILEKNPLRNCYYLDYATVKRTYCPIEVPPASASGDNPLRGTGSCDNQTYSIP